MRLSFSEHMSSIAFAMIARRRVLGEEGGTLEEEGDNDNDNDKQM